jgi:hypothetical protein
MKVPRGQREGARHGVPDCGKARYARHCGFQRLALGLRRMPQTWDSLPERGEFELPVPICEQSDDSIRLSFATSRDELLNAIGLQRISSTL